MNLLNGIKDSITNLTINNLAEYLGEDINGIKSGLDLNISTFAASVIDYTDSDRAADKLISILEDGGHTGEIMNNLESFSANPEKLALIETIGGNIANHFLGSGAASASSQIAHLTGIKNSSSTVLQKIAAPLVLGFLGREVRVNNLKPIGLLGYLNNQSEQVYAELPESIKTTLRVSKKESKEKIEHEKAVNRLNKSNSKGIDWGMILPWILLLFLAGLVFYLTKIKKKEIEAAKPAIVNESDTLKPADFLPLDTLAKVKEGEVAVLPADTVEVDKPKIEVETKPLPAPEPKKEVVEKPKVISKPPAVKPKPKTQAKAKPTVSHTKSSNSSKKADSYIQIPKGYNDFAADLFASESAEVIGGSALSSLLNQLKGNDKTITLTPLAGSGRLGKDRAYAIQGYLYENGISRSRINIAKSISGKTQNGLLYKISD